MKYLSLDEKLYRHRILIRNGIKDPVISERMACYGYTPEKMKQTKSYVSEDGRGQSTKSIQTRGL